VPTSSQFEVRLFGHDAGVLAGALRIDPASNPRAAAQAAGRLRETTPRLDDSAVEQLARVLRLPACLVGVWLEDTLALCEADDINDEQVLERLEAIAWAWGDVPPSWPTELAHTRELVDLTSGTRYRRRPIVRISQAALEPWVEADALRTKSGTRLARWRLRRGVTQTKLAEATGIPIASYRRLERGQRSAPPLWQLTNCAYALGVDLTDLFEDAWLEWRAPGPEHQEPPNPRRLWRRPPDRAT
jgi:DNA-binding XRE family transcriptional regulator